MRLTNLEAGFIVQLGQRLLVALGELVANLGYISLNPVFLLGEQLLFTFQLFPFDHSVDVPLAAAPAATTSAREDGRPRTESASGDGPFPWWLHSPGVLPPRRFAS